MYVQGVKCLAQALSLAARDCEVESLDYSLLHYIWNMGTVSSGCLWCVLYVGSMTSAAHAWPKQSESRLNRLHMLRYQAQTSHRIASLSISVHDV
jgi:tryptophan-rich sensory protein